MIYPRDILTFLVNLSGASESAGFTDVFIHTLSS